MEDFNFLAIALMTVWSAISLREYYRTRKQAVDLRPWTAMGEAPKVEPSNFGRVALTMVVGALSVVVLTTGMEVWSRWVRPRHEVYRDSLLKVAVPALQCPAEKLAFEQVDALGARVSGCGRSAQFVLLSKPGKKYGEPMWFPDSGCRETHYLVIHFPC